MNGVRDTFERVYAASDDPWGFRTSWYEARKRSILLACLPRQRYRSGYEPGCSNGELAAVLALRCERLLVHRMLDAHLGLVRLVHHEEVDFVLDVWCADARSVAQREGLHDEI